ncbi:MAG: dephospho-CoA kinase [Acidimicrobiia bacterium]|nr:dephospho-CoA kinase [Acidimicrobiia bacterium]
MVPAAPRPETHMVQGPGSRVQGSGSTGPVRVALTGGIATGKSRCLAVCAAMGVPTIDADRLARDVVAPGTPGLQAVVDRFGRAVLNADRTLNREALGALVFVDTLARHDLEGIIHPQVYAAITRWFMALEAPLGLADIPLLFETGHEQDFDVVIVAACRPDQQLQRLMERSGLSGSDAHARIEAQWPLADKVARAHYVIDTSGTLDDTDRRTRDVIRALSQRSACS